MKPKTLLAEFIGVFALCFFGVMAVYNLQDQSSGLLGIGLAFGVAIMVCVSALGAISGGHFNPAVSLGLLIAKKIDVKTFISYCIIQVIGGVAGAGAAAVLVPGTRGVAVPGPGEGVAPFAAVGLECIATFFLMLAVFGTAVDKRSAKVGGLYIGLIIAFGIIAIGPYTGGALNPARYFGPAIVAGDLKNFWIYLLGPCVGASLATVAWLIFFDEETAKD
jgi:aquaporin Z